MKRTPGPWMWNEESVNGESICYGTLPRGRKLGYVHSPFYLAFDLELTFYIQREFILRYEDLDNRMDPSRTLSRVGFPQHGS